MVWFLKKHLRQTNQNPTQHFLKVVLLKTFRLNLKKVEKKKKSLFTRTDTELKTLNTHTLAPIINCHLAIIIIFLEMKSSLPPSPSNSL